jgi:hypothetical protein
MAMPGNWSGDPNRRSDRRDARTVPPAGADGTLEPFGDPSPLGDGFVDEILAKGSRRDQYDARLAYALSIVSAWSYGTGEALQSKLRCSGFPDCTVDEIAITNHALFIVSTAYVVRSACGRLAIVVFRGTEPVNLISWLTDADVILRELPTNWLANGVVHRGFLANLEPVWDGIQTALRKATALEAIYVTGHSLGGAMAVLAAARLLASRPYAGKVEGVYTYGQPAVGNGDFATWGAKAMGSMLFRHVYNHDIVPHLPPASSGDFVHFGCEYRSNGTATKEVWQASAAVKPLQFALGAVAGALLEFATRRTTWLRWVPFRSSIDDHSPAFYITTSRNSL